MGNKSGYRRYGRGINDGGGGGCLIIIVSVPLGILTAIGIYYFYRTIIILNWG